LLFVVTILSGKCQPQFSKEAEKSRRRFSTAEGEAMSILGETLGGFAGMRRIWNRLLRTVQHKHKKEFSILPGDATADNVSRRD